MEYGKDSVGDSYGKNARADGGADLQRRSEGSRAAMDAVGTDAENEARESYIAELEEDIMPIGKLIGFADSEAGKAYFGAEKAAGIAAHAREIQAAGAKYCDCPACAIAEEILALKDRLLG